ncbi:MAG: hypothetical protein LBP22_12625 [Deltaproteobacteria bacterium]|jgi:nucleoside phosphorylase|nr:hypothetical protein [Deltaproteobacteria bacterium]
MDNSPELAWPWTKLKPPVPPRGLLCAGWPDKIAHKLNLMPGRSFLGGMVKLWEKEGLFLAGPVLGAPLAVMALEILARREAKEIIFLGLAGSLTTRLNPGDLFIPTYGFSTEGTSTHYPSEPGPDKSLTDRALTIKPDLALGPIWTTDAPFRETRDLVRRFQEKEALAVDMESTALMAAAGFRYVKFMSLLVISDQFSNDSWKSKTGDPQVKQGFFKAAALAANLLLN